MENSLNSAKQFISRFNDGLADPKSEFDVLSEEARIFTFLLSKQKKIEYTSNIFKEYNAYWEDFQNIFRGEYEKIESLQNNYRLGFLILKLGIILGTLELEDLKSIFHTLYPRYISDEAIISEANIIVVQIIKNIFPKTKQIVKLFKHTLRFLGIPILLIDESEGKLDKKLLKYFNSIQLVSIQNHPDFLSEIIKSLNYDETIDELSYWLKNHQLNELQQEILANIYSDQKIKEKININDFHSKMKTILLDKQMSKIPINFSSFYKQYSKNLNLQQVRPGDMKENIPEKILKNYLTKLAFRRDTTKSDQTSVTFLGGYGIGNMGILVSTGKSNILIDYGFSIANGNLPIWDSRLPHLDAILVTHSHLDHIGGIPALYSKNTEIPCFSSKMTKIIGSILINDNNRMINNRLNNNTRLMSSDLKPNSSIDNMMDNHVSIEPFKEISITEDVSVIPYPANHIQGSYGYQLFANGKSIFYSGDTNLVPSALFSDPIKFPTDSDITIMDGTYYQQPDFNLTKSVKKLVDICSSQKRVIIPSFAVGRAQEILLHLEKAGITKQRTVRVLGMASRITEISRIKTKAKIQPGYDSELDDEIIISGGGMVQGGYARKFIEETKEDIETSIILCGYLARNTFGNRLNLGLDKAEYKQQVNFCKFSGHSPSSEIDKFLAKTEGKQVLVHIGDLSKDPLKLEKSIDIKKYQRYILPNIGESLTLN